MFRKIVFLLTLVLPVFVSDAAESTVVRLGGAQLDIFTPDKPTGAAVLLCPGGGYRKKVIAKEGYLFAPFFMEKGITLAVLDYRLPGGDQSRTFGDAQTAMRYLHENAPALGLDRDRIGIMGGSAGGHIAAVTSVLAPEEIAPRFQILLYPLISLTDQSIGHKDATRRLLGDDACNVDTLRRYSPELNVTPHTPEAFIVLTADDAIVNPDNSLVYARALRRCGVGCELLMFAHGRHGFGANDIEFRSTWLDALSQWLDVTVLAEKIK